MKSPHFVALTASPLNGAPSPDALVRAHVTNVNDFFVRNHGDPPPMAPDRMSSLHVHGLVRTPLELPHSLNRPINLPRTTIEATLQCAGNRRSALQGVRPIPNEVPWRNEAIGNAIWEGVSLAAVLDLAGVTDGAAHVWFEGGETLGGKHAGENFGASIPLEKARSGNVILADTMNGAALGREHGAPLRAVVPGFIGARSVKWLSAIRVESEPSPNYFQRAYSVFPAALHSVPLGHAGGTVLGELPINSAFGTPQNGMRLPGGRVTARGWAMAGGDRIVERVEVSADGGATWLATRLISPPTRFVWRLWEAELSLAGADWELACRAFDSAGNAQPADPREVWNVKGYANNSWDRVRVQST